MSAAARQPSTDAVINAAHLARQRAFSERTFGPGPRTKGVLEHIRKELTEVEEAPLDLGEWVDIAILALDGAWRAGHAPQQIIDAIVAKQTRNESRVWPDWRTADPNRAIEHDRSAEPTDVCAKSQRVDGPHHSWGFDGDDPRVVCVYCGSMRDAITGELIRRG